MAHGMYPTGVQSAQYVTASLHKVEFNLFNDYDSRQCYDIAINDQIMIPYRICLSANQHKSMRVYVNSLPNQWSVNQICSISEPHGALRSEMCLETQTFFYQ
ncbi:hypothetical protein [Vibrio harveyi]|uniref:hypothetical protein n=1 Tax=Vibrio harveyi TaxID=669 RepID=UPI003CF9CDF3